jgi:trehalose-6-phosphate synthase
MNPKSVLIMHDNHLLMLPFYLILSNKHSYIIAVQVQPFPSSDFFMQCPYRLEIVRSLMNCSVFSFYSFQCAKHFINSIKKLLEIEVEMEYIFNVGKVGI